MPAPERHAVTDAGLARLKGLRMLLFVDLRGTGVTDKGAAELRKASRRIRIIR